MVRMRIGYRKCEEDDGLGFLEILRYLIWFNAVILIHNIFNSHTIYSLS
jgi:hypothetical protein